MGNITKKTVVIFSCMAVCHGALAAEYRMWTDKKGNSIEAELVCESAGKIVIRDRQGKLRKLAPEKLSAVDQKYLRTAFPPKVEIVFSKKQKRTKNDGYWAWVDMECEIAIKKKSRMPYDGTLTAMLLVVGRDDNQNDYILLDKVEATFGFAKSKSFLLKGNHFRMREYNGYYSSNDGGTKYVGYLAVVLDKDGNVVGVKASRKEFSEKCKMMLKIKKGAHFNKDMRVRDDSSKSYY